MDGSKATRNENMVFQNMLEALIKYGIIEEDEITETADSIVTTELLWKLFLKSEIDFKDRMACQNKELIEVQNYVDHVRSLSEERDQLTNEFGQENERLKCEIKQIREKIENEKEEVADMCQQENLEELIGSNFSEQIAYLLVVRATLLDKEDAMQEQLDESFKAYHELQSQVKTLTSEDSELQQRMNNAMSEMGGMASKLTDAIRERDSLKTEVVELKKVLDGIKALPSIVDMESQNKAHLNDLDDQTRFYRDELQRVRDELQETKQSYHIKHAELSTEIEELQEVNCKLQEVNKHLNKEVNQGGQLKLEADMEKMHPNSHQIIEEMRAALEEDGINSGAEQTAYEEEIKKLREKIVELENVQVASLEEQQSVAQLNFQLTEAQSCNDYLQDEVDKLQEKLKATQRELSANEITTDSRNERLQVQMRITTELQERNAGLESELTKIWGQLKDNLEKLNNTEHDRSMLELKVSQLENLVLSETTGTCAEDKLANLMTQIEVYEAQLIEEKQTRSVLEEKLSASQTKVKTLSAEEDELRSMLSQLQQRALNAEAQVLLVSGAKAQEETQKLVAELNRSQLEDAIDLIRRRLDVSASQVQNYSNRYRSLKQKHKTKIRRIRELFLLERKATSEEIERLERNAMKAEQALKSELTWKDQAACDICAAERERRNAINQAEIAIKKVEESSEQINHLRIVKEGLEGENGMLQKQLKLLEKQKVELEKMIDEMQQRKQKEELNTLLSSLNLSGSLPYSGQTIAYPLNQSFMDSLSNGPIITGVGDNARWNDAMNRHSFGSSKDSFNSSYLNLSQGDLGASKQSTN